MSKIILRLYIIEGDSASYIVYLLYYLMKQDNLIFQKFYFKKTR